MRFTAVVVISPNVQRALRQLCIIRRDVIDVDILKRST